VQSEGLEEPRQAEDGFSILVNDGQLLRVATREEQRPRCVVSLGQAVADDCDMLRLPECLSRKTPNLHEDRATPFPPETFNKARIQ